MTRAANLLIVASACIMMSQSACQQTGRAPLESDPAAPILLFAGTGASANGVAAIEAILEQNGHRYSVATSNQLEAMSDTHLLRYRLLIVPGGNFEVMGKNLSPGATANIHRAVHEGLNYLGICAGAFFASDSGYNSVNLTSGVRFRFYAASDRGIRITPVTIATINNSPLDVYWEDGPQLSGWGQVIAKYPDGTPAVVQGEAGKGWVVLTGIHAEAPKSWRGNMTFKTTAAMSHAFAAELIDAALNRRALPHY
jgi:glutamine amidotransferase-like uncharacterized protein